MTQQFQNPFKYFLSFNIIMSILMAFMCSNWLSLWIIMEFNMISILPLFLNNMYLSESHSLLKYFIIQSIGSCLFLLISISNYYNMFFNMIMFSQMILIFSMLLKLGAAPLHFWLPPTMNNSSWFMCLLIMTIQKIIPLLILNEIIPTYMSKLMMFIIIWSVITSTMNGITETSMKKILSFSSINHMGWMFSALLLNSQLLFSYFCIYIIMNTSIIYFLSKLNSLNLNNFSTPKFNSNKTIFVFSMLMLSLGGLPPLLGFWPKLLIINMLTSMNMILPTFFLIMGSMGTLIFYSNISFSAIMAMNTNNKIYNKSNKFTSTMMMIMMMASMPMPFMLFM